MATAEVKRGECDLLFKEFEQIKTRLNVVMGEVHEGEVMSSHIQDIVNVLNSKMTFLEGMCPDVHSSDRGYDIAGRSKRIDPNAAPYGKTPL